MKVCDQDDCLFHPDYVNPEDLKKEEEPFPLASEESRLFYKDEDLYFSDGSTWTAIANQPRGAGQYISVSDSTYSISASDLMSKISTENIECPIECLFCKHRKPLDMKEIIYRNKAKKELENGN